MSTNLFINGIESIFRSLIDGIMTDELLNVFSVYYEIRQKDDIIYEDYNRLIDLCKNIIENNPDNMQVESIKELIKYWEEEASIKVYQHLFHLGEKVDRKISQGIIEETIQYYDEAHSLGKKIGDQSTADYIADNIATAYFENKNYEKVIDWGSRIREPSYDILFCLGYSFYENMNYEKSFEAYDRATQFSESSEDAWYNKALCLQQLGRIEEAVINYKHVISINMNHSQAYRNLIKILESHSKLDEALSYLDEFIQIERNDPELWNRKGNILSNNLNEYQKAIECYNKAISIDKNYYLSWYNMGLAYTSLNDYQKAINSYKNAIKTQKNDREVWYQKGKAEQELNLFKEALKSYRQVVKINPEDSSGWFEIGIILYNLGKYKEAIKAYERYLLINKDDVSVLKNIASCYWQLEQYASAIEYYDKIIDIYPDSLTHFFLTDKVYNLRIRQKYSEALNLIEKILNLYPGKLDALNEKSLILQIQEKFSEALKIIEHTLMIDEENTQALIFKGSILFDQNFEAEQAYDCFVRASKIDPNNLDISINIPEALMVLERYEDAIEKSREALEKNLDIDRDIAMHFIIFSSLLLNNKKEEAWNELKKIMNKIRKHFRYRKVGWTFHGSRRFLEKSSSEHNQIILHLIDLFERKLALPEFRKKAKKHFMNDK